MVHYVRATAAILGLLSGASANFVYVDEKCSTYCSEYYQVCVNPSVYDYPGTGYSSLQDCRVKCMNFPRLELTYIADNEENFFMSDTNLNENDAVNLGGDSFECRRNHLTLAMTQSKGGASTHCAHAALNGGKICSDHTFEDGLSPFALMVRSKDTFRHVGYCDLYWDNKIANCMRVGIDDENVKDALSMLPDTVEHLFLHRNSLTELKSRTFDSLRSKSTLKSLYLDGNGITSVATNTFSGMSDLETLSLNINLITDLPRNLLKPLEKLVHFSMFGLFNTGELGNTGLMTDDGFPEDFFRPVRKTLENIIMYGHVGITTLKNRVDHMPALVMLSFVDSGLTDEGMNPDYFRGLRNIEYFDFFGVNPVMNITKVQADWVIGKANLHRFMFWGNQVTEIEGDLLGQIKKHVTGDNFQFIFLHGNPLTTVGEELADYCVENGITLSVGTTQNGIF